MRSKRNRKSGFTLVEVLLVASIVGLLAAIAIPSLTKATSCSQMRVCQTNLRMIEDAIETVMASSNFVSTSSISVVMVNGYLRAGAIEKLSWPREVAPPSDVVIKASDTNGVFVMFAGARLTSGRESV